MKKAISLFLALVVLMILLAGCNSPANETQIRSDLELFTRSTLLGEGEEIKQFEIEKRQTDKDNKMDVIWCSMITEDTECRYEKSAILTYRLYDKGGWILDDVIADPNSEWNTSPRKGVNDADILTLLYGKTITIGDDQWKIDKDNAQVLSVDKHVTDLEAKQDTLLVTLKIDDLVEKASGQLEVNYKFGHSWQLDSFEESIAFTTEVKSGKELIVTEETLIEKILKEELNYGYPQNIQTVAYYDPATIQPVTIQKDNIKNIEIVVDKAGFKGISRDIEAEGTIHLPLADFSIESKSHYYYDETQGWIEDTFKTNLKCTSLHLQGSWSGTYDNYYHSGDATLNIASIDDAGNIRGTYSYTPTETKNREVDPGSYEVSGTISMVNFTIELEDGSWINQPQKSTFVDKGTINLRFYLDESRMQGIYATNVKLEKES